MAIEMVPVLPDGEILHHVPSQFLPEHRVRVTTTGPQRHGVFKSVTATTQTTTEITLPAAGGAIVITDLLITTNKQAGGIATLRFSDSVPNTVNIAVFPVDLAVNQSIAFVGLFRGWRDAKLELVTSGATFDATVTAGYMKVPDGLEFAEWDALR